MKKLGKILIILISIIGVIVVLIYGGVFLAHKVIFPIKTSKIISVEAVTDGTFTFGLKEQSLPLKIDDYVEILAKQLKNYNKVAKELWPDNQMVDEIVIVEEISSKKMWVINPDGLYKPITKKEFSQYGAKRLNYFNGFSFFPGGTYLAISKEDLNNYLIYENYLHLGTYDPFITYCHEGFHGKEQNKWRGPEVVNNSGREDFFDNLPARAMRVQLQKQLFKAVGTDDKQLILDALATYVDWKEKYPKEYEDSLYFDRIEGTAFYFELVSCLYAAYPEQIKDSEDVDKALSLLASREEIYLNYGLVAESYTVGGFACVLLDRYDNNWKETIIDNPEMTPMELLLQNFENEKLPMVIEVTAVEIKAVENAINSPKANRGYPLFFRVLYEILY